MTCKDCVHYDVCQYHIDEETDMTITECGRFINKADFVEVVRCKDCMHSREFDKHCEINRFAHRHCAMDRGEEIKNVWHKYKKYYKDYSVVDYDGFCSYGERKEQ